MASYYCPYRYADWIRKAGFFLCWMLSIFLLETPSRAQENSKPVKPFQPAQEIPLDLAVGNLTIETNTVIPGLQNANFLEGVFFIYGTSSLPSVPIVVYLEIRDSNNVALFSWSEKHVILNDVPPALHYEGRYRYPIPENQPIPLDLYSLYGRVEVDPERTDLFPNGVPPVEADLTNNSNQSTPTRILQLSGRMRFGDIVTTLTALEFYDPANNTLSGSAAWKEDISVSFINLPGMRDDATLDWVVTEGSVPFTTPTPVYSPPPGAVRYEYRNGTLGANGAYADLFWALPPGVGYRDVDTWKITFAGTPLPLGNQKLNQDLQLPAPVPIPYFLIWISEGLPIQIRTGGQTLDPAAGMRLTTPTCTYQYADHFQEQPALGKASNDAYFNSPLAFSGEVMFASGGLQADLQAADLDYTASFPLSQVKGKNLTIRIRDGKIAASDSAFDSVEITLPLDNNGCTVAEPAPVTLAYTGAAKMGTDGSVVIDQPLAAPFTPQFNTYQFGPVANAPWYQPGYRLPDESATGLGVNVAEYLLAMRDRESEDLFSYGEEPFRLGSDLFAGANLFPGEFNGKPFALQITTKTLNLTSTEWTKLYVRAGGYSGVVDARNQDDAFEIYPDPDCGNKGYDLTLASFGQAYLSNDSTGLDSTTDGDIDIPWPSLITVPFERMTLNACGNLAQGQVPAGVKNEEKLLAYWTAKIYLLTLAFEKRTPAAPDTDRTLWLSTRNPIEHVADEAIMQVNVRPCGTLRDSRIDQPLLTRYDGYPATFQKVYFSAFDNNPTQPNGFYNLAGDLHVSLFDPPRVHAQVSGFVGTLSDGSPWFGAGDPDINRDGFPDGFVSTAPVITEKIAQYVSASPIPVQTRFADLITLKYKLAYNSAKKEFRTQTPIKENLIVLDIDSAVEYLNAVRTEISFGVAVNGTPKVSLASKFSEITGLQNTFLGPIRDKLEEAEKSLKGDLSAAVRPVIEPLLNPLADEFIRQFHDRLALLPATKADYENFLSQANNDFDRALDDLLAKIDLHTLLTRRDNPAIQKIRDIKKLLDDVEAAMNFSTDQLSPLLRAILDHTVHIAESYKVNIDQLLEPVKKVQAEILAVLRTKVRPALTTAEQVLDPSLLLDSVFPLAQVQNEMVPQVKKAVRTAMLNAVRSTQFQSVQAIQSRDITRIVINEIFNSIPFQKLTITTNLQLQPASNLLREQAEQLLTGVNQAVDTFVQEQVGKLEGAVADLKGVQGFKGASLKGYAIVSGNTLEKLRIEGNFSSQTPDDITYNAYLDMTRYKVGYKGKNCVMPVGSGPVMDTRIGSKDVEIKIGDGKLKADIELQLMTDNTKLVNIGGSIYGRGTVRTGKLGLTDPGFRVSVGSDENYFIAFVKEIEFDRGKLKGGVFLGITSCKDPLVEISPEADFLFKAGRFRGIYSYGEGRFNVIDYGCALRAGAEGGVSFWVFADGPTIGGKIYAGLFGEAGCVVQAKGRVTLLGSYDGADFIYRGDAWIAGGVGFCEEEDWKTPADVLDDGFCLACVASFDLLYKNGWSSNYHVDCD